MTKTDIRQGDCNSLINALPDNSVDAVVTDPPFGTLGEPWDKPEAFTRLIPELDRVCTNEAFISFFWAMPALLEWCAALEQTWQWAEHVVWVKRTVTPQYRLSRGHSDIFIYRRDRAQFFKTEGPYMDVKLPLLATDCITPGTFKRRHRALLRNHKNRPSPQKGQHDRYNRNQREQDSWAIDKTNFCNVWSFLPANQTSRNGQYKHKAAKPANVMKRLVEMLSPPGGTVLDPFMGSGSTGVAARDVGREFVGFEKKEEFYAIAEERLEHD